ncbi:MAG: hypothetical protein EHM70_16080 [Chloroflexota bacterium]|nr:MAG: hypothetical protein EHM70_16080 [Chloroflexota bacterium]
MRTIRLILIISVAISVLFIGFAGYQMIKEEGFNWMPLGVLAISLVVVFATTLPFLKVLNQNEMKGGEPAAATVLKVWDTGTTINDDPLVGLLLEVRPLGMSPYQAEAKTIVSRLEIAMVRPGVTAQVKYDPKKPSKIAVVSIEARPEPTDASGRMEELEELRTKRLVSEEEYQKKREEILKAL